MKFQLLLLAICLMQVNCGIYSLYTNHRNFYHDLSFKDKVQMGSIVGDRRAINADDKHVRDLLDSHLGRLITGDKEKFVVDEITEVSKQIVSGVSYRVHGHYHVEGELKECTITILEKYLPNQSPQEDIVISAKCEDGSCYVTDEYVCSPKSLNLINY